jgi:hypothetical protein
MNEQNLKSTLQNFITAELQSVNKYIISPFKGKLVVHRNFPRGMTRIVLDWCIYSQILIQSLSKLITFVRHHSLSDKGTINIKLSYEPLFDD